jgi:Arc/MetJ-type ribon-helix-helix transcriptional regulator
MGTLKIWGQEFESCEYQYMHIGTTQRFILMVHNKRVTIRFTPEQYIKMDVLKEQFEFKTVPDLIKRAVENYLEQTGHPTENEMKKMIAEFLNSEEGEMLFSELFDKELARRAET